jgi:hypothetical protein
MDGGEEDFGDCWFDFPAKETPQQKLLRVLGMFFQLLINIMSLELQSVIQADESVSLFNILRTWRGTNGGDNKTLSISGR